MTDFSKAIHDAAEAAALKLIREGGWIQPDYHNRFVLPKDFMADIWKLVDQDKVRAQMAKILEKELAERIMASIATEMTNDIKVILSNNGCRAAIREVANDNIKKILNAKD